MSTQTFDSSLTLFVGAVLVCAVAVLWLSAVRAVVRVLAVQGLALGAVAATLGFHVHDAGLVATAAVVVGDQGGAHPGACCGVSGRVTRPSASDARWSTSPPRSSSPPP